MKAVSLIISRWQNTVPNYITLGRFVICAWGLNAFYWWYWNPWCMLLVCSFGMALDGLDGWVARNYDQVSFSGKLLDPFVDKLTTWNAAVVIAAWAATKADTGASIIVVLCVPMMALIAIYDYMTMSLRASDEQMVTNPVAKVKQATLFASLGAFLFGMCFADLPEPQRPVFYATQMLFIIFAGFLMFHALRLTARSAKIYFQQTRDPHAMRWAKVFWIRAILVTLA